MALTDVRAIMPIERDIYPSPWTYGNFRDAIGSGYPAWVVQVDGSADPIGYALVMNVLDECHLLNLSVARGWQGQGIGRWMLAWLLERAGREGAVGMFLEVRPSNASAVGLYQSMGFVRIGLRRDYYPCPGGGREDAIVMRKAIEARP